MPDQGYGVYCSRFVCLDESGRTKAINNAVLLVPAEGVDFYHSYRVGKPEGTEETSYRYQFLGYDGESGTYGFLVTITPTNGDKRPAFVQGQTYTLSVGQLLLAQKKQQQTFRPDWTSLPREPERILREYYSRSFADNYRRPVPASDHKVEVLAPEGWGVPLADGFVVTAAGFTDNGFHVQMRYPDKKANFDYGELVLAMADGNVVGNVLGQSDAGNFCSVGFYDEAGYRYEEFIYDILPGDLKGASLQGDFTSGGYLLDGQWEVGFCLDNGQESEAHTVQE